MPDRAVVMRPDRPYLKVPNAHGRDATPARQDDVWVVRSMQGYVFSFRPQTGEGTIVGEGGQAYPFCADMNQRGWQAGDVVSFEPGADPSTERCGISRLHLVERGAKHLACGQRVLLETFYQDLGAGLGGSSCA